VGMESSGMVPAGADIERSARVFRNFLTRGGATVDFGDGWGLSDETYEPLRLSLRVAERALRSQFWKKVGCSSFAVAEAPGALSEAIQTYGHHGSGRYQSGELKKKANEL
jgi:hypothetical protein